MTDPAQIAEALLGLQAWMETVRGPDGYYGPVIGTRGVSMQYAGPGIDLRMEGMIDAHIALHRATGDKRYLENLKRDVQETCDAQLKDGSFKNSYFEFNPFEGGMPHEPAVVAALFRARRYLAEHQVPFPLELDNVIELFVEHRLITELWCKRLQTFNDWLISDFEWYTPHAVAAVIEVLVDYAELRKEWDRLEHYVVGAANSLVAIQRDQGPTAGAIPLSNRRGSAINPYAASRCVPGLQAAAAACGDDRFKRSAENLVDFVRGQALKGGGFSHLVHTGRNPTIHPIFTGAVAGTLLVFKRSGILEEDDLNTHLPLLINHRMESGALLNAIGFGDGGNQKSAPDWRDVLPVTGWQAQAYALFATLHEGKLNEVASLAITEPVSIRRHRATYTEDTDIIRIKGDDQRAWYEWKKRTRWASECLL